MSNRRAGGRPLEFLAPARGRYVREPGSGLLLQGCEHRTCVVCTFGRGLSPPLTRPACCNRPACRSVLCRWEAAAEVRCAGECLAEGSTAALGRCGSDDHRDAANDDEGAEPCETPPSPSEDQPASPLSLLPGAAVGASTATDSAAPGSSVANSSQPLLSLPSLCDYLLVRPLNAVRSVLQRTTSSLGSQQQQQYLIGDGLLLLGGSLHGSGREMGRVDRDDEGGRRISLETAQSRGGPPVSFFSKLASHRW